MYVDKVTGARMIDATKCIGCGLCAKACPYNSDGHIIKYNASKNVYVKCDMCTGRADGPACVQACKWGALEVKKL
jgi:carbon-monoxide dehydrogenase iron sulfur subunit